MKSYKQNLNENKPILIQGAFEPEVCRLRNILNNAKTKTICGFSFCIGEYENHPVIIQKTFMGMTNAAAATMLAIEHFSPALIINQGICGGHSPLLHRGDILLGEKIINYANLQIKPTSSSNPLDGCTPIGLEPIRDASAPDYGKKLTAFFSDPELIAIAKSQSWPECCHRIVCGTIASADAWTDRKDLIACLHQSLGSFGEDMETVSVAQLCHSFSIPFLSIRMLSNTLVHDEEYDVSIADSLQTYTESVLKAIATQK